MTVTRSVAASVAAAAALALGACDSGMPEGGRTRDTGVSVPTVVPAPGSAPEPGGSAPAPAPAPGEAPAAPAPPATPEAPPPPPAAVIPEAVAAHGVVGVPTAPAGTVDVVAVGATDAEAFLPTLPLVVHNNTDAPVNTVSVLATGSGPDGSEAATFVSGNFYPNVLQPGEWGFSEALFLEGTAVAGSTYEHEIDYDRELGAMRLVDLVPSGVAPSPGAITGTITNTTQEAVLTPISVSVLCFDALGTTPAATAVTYLVEDEIAPAASLPFSIPIEGECANFVVAGSGWKLQ